MQNNGAGSKTSNYTWELGVRAPADSKTLIGQRRRRRFALFLVVEAAAIVLFVGSLLTSVLTPFAAESFTPFFRVIPIGSAIVAAVVPILFFGNPMRD